MNAQAQKVLVADDDLSSRLVLSQALSRFGYQVRATNSASALLKWVSDGEGHLVVADMVMADDSGLDLASSIRKRRPDLPVILTSPHNTLMSAVTASESGAYDYLAKPFDLDLLEEASHNALARPLGLPKATVRAIRDEQLPMIGRSPPMQKLYRTMARLIRTDLAVLILGETGSGKALVARALHDLGRRRAGKFISVNLAGTSPAMLERELFGDGAGEAGTLVEAEGGTLYLDDLGDAPIETQTRLLSLLGRIEARPKPGAQIIASTNRDLMALIHKGLFREDLYFRLNVASLHLPPLRDRVDDIPDLVSAFLLRASREGLGDKVIDAVALAQLKSHAWPGNVRELQNLVRRLCAVYPEATITSRILSHELSALAKALPEDADQPRLSMAVAQRLAHCFDEDSNGGTQTNLYGQVMQEVEGPLLNLTLAAAQGNQVQAARMLGINRNTLRKKIEVLGVPSFRPKQPLVVAAATTSPADR